MKSASCSTAASLSTQTSFSSVFFLNDTGAGGNTHAVFNVNAADDGISLLLRHSRFYDYIATRLRRRSAIDELVRSYREGFRENAPGWKVARRSLRSAKTLADDRGVAMALAIFPVLWELTENSCFREIHDTVATFGRSLGLPVLDLLPEFIGLEGPSLWVNPTGQHPNEIAHEIAGMALHRFLLAEGLVSQE